jgi:hypothetical protein
MRFLLTRRGGSAAPVSIAGSTSMKFNLFLLVCLLLSAGLITAQQQQYVALPELPVPAWPEKGVTVAELKDNYVFIDGAKNEYVVAYPQNLGTEAFEKEGPGPIKIARYELHRNVTPSISVAITRPTPEMHKYAYSVSNGKEAQQSIDQWALSMPAVGGSSTIRYPEGWFAVVQKDRIFKVRNRQWIATGAAAVWSFAKPEEVIQPGGSKTGFELESSLRPGFTTSYFRKAESIEAKVATQGVGLPAVVQQQVDALLAVEHNSKTLLTLGPKYDGSATVQAIAADFVQGLEVLSRAGVLNASSPFVRNTLASCAGMRRILQRRRMDRWRRRFSTPCG